jgi:SAM-dependent methyltransferase
MKAARKLKNAAKIFTPSKIYGFTRRILYTGKEIISFPKSTISLIGQTYNLRKRYPSTGSVEVLACKYKLSPSSSSKSLDLGCGANPRNPFGAKEVFGVDIRSDLSRDIRQADLAIEAIPFGSDLFDFCTAFDVLEHIPRNSWGNGTCRLAFIELLNEIHRVLKPGGLFLHHTPAFPSKEAFKDPTHVNIITEDTMPNYFCEPFSSAKQLGYGFSGSFELVEQRWLKSIWIVGIMRALK